MSIGSRIKELRIAKDIPQSALADKINVSKQTLYKYEHDIVTNIPSNIIESIAHELNVTPAYLMGWDESKDNEQHYSNPQTAQIAQEVFDNHDLRILFDAAKDAKPQDIQLAADLLKRLKETNPDA